jgi:8-oxo-dGTP pyrophosphatase MutT (NUDIX family)
MSVPSPESPLAVTAGPSSATPPPARSDGFRFLGENELWRGWRISLTEARFRAPDGTEFTRDVVRHPGAVAVVPVNDDGQVLLVRQYRGSVDRHLLEIPAGTRDVDGEPAQDTARRELLEEVGVEAAHLRLLCVMLNTPGFCDEETHLFLATGLTEAATDRHGPEEENMEVVPVALSDIDAMVSTGELIDAQTILGILLARPLLGIDTAASG